MLKRKDVPYQAGRPASGGHGLKRKFTNDASVIVTGQHGDKHSVEIALYDGTPLGACTLKPRQNMSDFPKGTVIDVKYLYRGSADGHLVQPTNARIRDDVRPQECTANRLRVKGAPR